MSDIAANVLIWLTPVAAYPGYLWDTRLGGLYSARNGRLVKMKEQIVDRKKTQFSEMSPGTRYYSIVVPKPMYQLDDEPWRRTANVPVTRIEKRLKGKLCYED